MKLDYKIFWIEDDEMWMKSIKNKIESFIERKGYVPIIKNTPNADPSILYENARDSDLILVDYVLKGFSNNGDIFIEEFRNNKIYTNIVFYSSNYDEIKTKITENELKGTYFFDRNDFGPSLIETSLFELIDFFLNRDADINSLRGIAMAEVASFDKKIGNIIFCEKHKSKIIKKVREKTNKRCQDLSKKSEDKIWEKLQTKDSTILLDSKTRADFLSEEILKDFCRSCDKNKKPTCYNVFINDYSKEIIEQRNKLAHQIENAEIDELAFRKSLIKFRELLKEISSCSKIIDL